MRILTLLTICFAAVSAVPYNHQRIVGGSEATIDQHPSIAALLHVRSGLFSYKCGATIINNRSILTAAQCTANEVFGGLRFRVGSTWANSGGVVHNVNGNIVHPLYNPNTFHNDIAILRSATAIIFNNYVSDASLAGPNYIVDDHASVLAVGWGATSHNGLNSEGLRDVYLWAYNQATCWNNYAQLTNFVVTENMLCAGWPFNGERDQCDGDTGGPLYHNGVLVGVFSLNFFCGSSFLPAVNTRVSSYIDWIVMNV